MDILYCSAAVDFCVLDCALASVKVHQGLGLLVVHRQSFTHRDLGIVLALLQRLTGNVIDAILLGGIVNDVIDTTGSWVYATSGNTLDSK